MQTMKGIQIEALRAELARDILNEQDENLLKKVIAYFAKEKKAKMTFEEACAESNAVSVDEFDNRFRKEIHKAYRA